MKLTTSAFILPVFAIALSAQSTDLPKPENPVPVFRWGIWNAGISPDGTIQHMYISYDEREEMDILLKMAREEEQRRRKEYGIEPNDWKVIACFSDSIDMVFVDEDGTRFNEKGGLGPEDIEWVKRSYREYKEAAYAFSRGSVKINEVERWMKEPLLGEYSGATSFWMTDWADLGKGLNVYDFDSVTGVWYEGPCRPWSRGAFLGGGEWLKRLGHSNAQFARGREGGGSISDISRISRHEWGHGVSGFVHKCGYTGLPTQYTPGNFHHGSHLFFFRNILAPAHWRKMRQHGPMSSPANRPNDRFLGFCTTWLATGPFNLPDMKKSSDAGLPHPEALDDNFISLNILPDENAGTSDYKWILLTNDWEKNGPDFRSVFPSPHVDTILYAHTYAYSPIEREAILWAGCMQPVEIYLNGTPALRFWRGGYEDGASRKIILKKGWNRVMYKVLDQGENRMDITLRFTDLNNIVLTDIKYSALKPVEDIVPEAAPLLPLEIKKFSWEFPVNDDWFGILPLLTEEHFDVILGVKGVRILGAPEKWRGRDLGWDERRWTLIDLSNIKGDTKIFSRIVPWNALKTTLENSMILDNHLVMSRELGNGQRSYESMGLIRYKKPDGKTGDIVFLRADVAEMFLETARRPDDAPKDFHKKNIIGYILRDTKNYIVLDTDLGGILPVNEPDMLVASKDGMELEASPNVPRVLRGAPASLNLIARWTGDKPVEANVKIKKFDTGEVLLERHTGEMAPLSEQRLSLSLDTIELSGLVNFIATIEFGERQSVEKPVPLPVFDPVNVSIRIEGSGIIQTLRQKVVITLSNNQEKEVSGEVVLALPDGWASEPASAYFSLTALDTTADAEFYINVPESVAKGWNKIGASIKVDGIETVSYGELPVLVSLEDTLVHQDFENGIGGSFSFVDGMYNVSANVSGAKEGQRCLQIVDRGGSHYGHVFMFGPGERPAPVPAGTEYSYDTKLYPFVEFWLKTNARDANLGIQIVLDDGDDGYGVLINGIWEQQWLPRILIGRAEGFIPDGEWHLIKVNIDEMLDRLLGKTSHFVKELQFGDTRGFASGWSWSFDYNRYYIDGFRIYRESKPVVLAHVLKTADGFERYSKTHRVPAFPSEPVNGVKLTLRTDRLEYNPWNQQELNIWATNISDKKISIPIEPLNNLIKIRITGEDGKLVGGEWITQSKTDSNGEATHVSMEVKHRDLRPGESYQMRINLNNFARSWMDLKKVKLESGKEYTIEVMLSNENPPKENYPKELFTGNVISNPMRISFAPVPTLDEEMEALKNSLSATRRARAAAQLGKAKHEPAIPILIEACTDSNENVRLNAVWALGNMPRFDLNNKEQETYRIAMKPAIDALRNMLNDPNWRVGEYAAQSLANLKATESLPDIIVRTKSESIWIRRKTADALRTMADPNAIKTLVKMMDDKERSVRQAALGALIEFANANLESAKNQKDSKHKSSKKNFDVAWAGIQKALKDEYFVIRRDAVNASVKYQPLVDAKEIVLRALNDPDDWVREAGIRALPELHDKTQDMEKKLISFMDDYWDNIRKAALESYPKVSGKSVEEGTGKTFGEWMRMYPRPGASWK